MEDDRTQHAQALPNRWRRWTLTGAAIAASVAAVASAFAWHGRAQAQPFGHHHGGWQSMDPATLGRRLDAMVGWALADIDATPEQRDRISAIFKAAANDLMPMRESHRRARQESLQLIGAPTIDRDRLEALRVQQMQLADSVSRRMLQAMEDAAAVLNPDQRAKLAAKWAERRGWHN